MAYKNSKGENLYMFGWLQAKPGSKDFRETTGRNSEWANTKREAISKVNRRRKEHEKQNPTHVQLRVNPSTVRRAKSYDEFANFDRALYMMTI